MRSEIQTLEIQTLLGHQHLRLPSNCCPYFCIHVGRSDGFYHEWGGPGAAEAQAGAKEGTNDAKNAMFGWLGRDGASVRPSVRPVPSRPVHPGLQLGNQVLRLLPLVPCL
eukprot:SAG22_NODE_2905_length_2114_cov_1.388586_2_plen_110_part_00